MVWGFGGETNINLKQVNMTNSDVAKYWNRLDSSDKLEIIENAIDCHNVSEGFLMLRLYSNDKCIHGYIQNNIDNHLCAEAVSQETLSELFDDNHDFEEADAEVILKWMESQK
jgi:hypothetical protein